MIKSAVNRTVKKSIKIILRVPHILCGGFVWFMNFVRVILNDNSNLIIACATCALVWVSYMNIDEARKTGSETVKLTKETKTLADETKKLADVAAKQLDEAKVMREQTTKMADNSSAQLAEAKKMAENSQKQMLETKRLTDNMNEQFRMRSYPTLFIVTKDILVESGKMIQEVTTYNKGEMMARELSTLIINLYHRTPFHRFIDIVDSFTYEYTGKKSVGDYEANLPQASQITLRAESKFPPSFDIETLNSFVIVSRFRVPYSKKYDYEITGFVMKADHKQHTLLSTKDSRQIIADLKKVVGFLSAEKQGLFEKFLVDYWQ
jgi:hypothetical protein